MHRDTSLQVKTAHLVSAHYVGPWKPQGFGFLTQLGDLGLADSALSSAPSSGPSVLSASIPLPHF